MFQVSTDKKGNGIQVRISSVAFDPSSWIPNWRENNKSPCWLEIKSTFYYKNKIIAHDLQITIVLIIFFSHKSHPLYRILQDRLRLYATTPTPPTTYNQAAITQVPANSSVTVLKPAGSDWQEQTARNPACRLSWIQPCDLCEKSRTIQLYAYGQQPISTLQARETF